MSVLRQVMYSMTSLLIYLMSTTKANQDSCLYMGTGFGENRQRLFSPTLGIPTENGVTNHHYYNKQAKKNKMAGFSAKFRNN